ncbi:hypothetical protein [Sabulibacter ruber]|uniref:hypothetical protein n=1 Tax=Sabulibacter ruber TaxID=2811901 RepID=UPI001A96BAD8|nr:hypothetical protein [Sabulibacter ruber]
MVKIYFIILTVCLICSVSSFGQNPTESKISPLDSNLRKKLESATPVKERSKGEDAENDTKTGDIEVSDYNYELSKYLSTCVLIFGVLIMIMIIYLIKTAPDKFETEAIVRLLTFPVIIISIILLITAGFTDKQIAPAVGLLGTLAGYMLGKGQ